MKAKRNRKPNRAVADRIDRGTTAGGPSSMLPDAGRDDPDAKTSAQEATRQEPGPTVEELRSRVAELEEQLLRAKAEQQNIRKRSANELAETVRYGNASLIKALLGTIDDLDRTLQQSASADTRTVLQGVRLSYDNFMKVLQDNRVEVVEALGKPFDPRYHDAVQQRPAGDKEPGTVIMVLQQGFKLGDRVLRPAKVIIAAPDDGADRESCLQPDDQEADAVAEER